MLSIAAKYVSRSRSPPSGDEYCRAEFCAFCTRSGVAGCDDKKSCARGSSEVLPAFIAALRSIALRKREAPSGSKSGGAELLRGREARHRQFSFRKRQRGEIRIVAHIRHHTRDNGRLARLIFPD